MTLNDLLDLLDALPTEAPLVFSTDAGPIGDGYHVTELKLVQVDSIDCGARRSNWTECVVQLLDGEGDGHMSVGKFSAIARQSSHKINGLADHELQVEFAPRNSGLRVFQPLVPELLNGTVALFLKEARAHCKPALERVPSLGTIGCCGTGSAGACCASA
ncbi:DUF6428 family protein [Roseibium sp. LAB1]